MQADRISRFLPETYRFALGRGDDVLGALLAVMSELHEPSERVLDDLDSYIDPARAPDRFVPMLAGWLDLARYLDWSGGRRGAGHPRFAPGTARLRLLVSRAADLSARRGTRAALQEFLEVATGIEGFAIEEMAPQDLHAAQPFRIRVHAPDAARRYADLIARIVDGERPAYVTYEIIYEAGATPAAAVGEKAHA